MTWRGFMIAGLLVLLSFSVSVAHVHAQTLPSRDPFDRIGVDIPAATPPVIEAPAAPKRPAIRRPVVQPTPQYLPPSQPFAVWLDAFKKEAVAKGIRPALVEEAFANIAPNDTVVRLDRKQPEGKISFSQYRTNVVNARRIAKGQALLAQYATTLEAISQQYAVPKQVIVALWGIETEFGANKGNFSLIRSLATLAYEGRRAAFFRNELHAALRIAQDEGVMGSALTGSWAGAMGHCQFMPTSFLKYAVDWDRDGHRDIWNSVPDALASIAHYLSQEGWNAATPWGFAVKLPAGFAEADADLYTAKPLKHWRSRGVTLANGAALPGDATVPAYVMYPGTPAEGAYLVFENYHVLLHWNRSRYFATSVGLLADAIAK